MRHLRLFEYTVTFESHAALLSLYKLRNPVDKRLKFSMTATPAEHLQMIVDNMNMRDSGWIAGECITGPAKTLSYNHVFCSDALNQIAEGFDTEFEVDIKKISLKKVEYNRNNPLPLAYGKGKGFRPGVGRTNFEDTLPVSVLYVQGGSRNIDAGKYGSSELLLPKMYTLRYDGKHFEDEEGFDGSNARAYETSYDGLSITRIGGAGGVKQDDSLDCSEVYPHRDEKVLKVIAVNTEKNWYDVVTDVPESLDYSQYGIGGETPAIVFQDGMLAGRELDLETDDDGNIICEKYYEDGFFVGWKFQIVPAEIDGVTMPGGSFLPAVGDIFRVFGIALPQAYISDDETKSGASWEMFRQGVRYLYEHEDARFTFTGELDGIWAKKDWINIGGRIKLGGYVSFTNEQFQKDPVLIRITGIKDYINNPYSPEIELSNSTVGGGVAGELNQIKNNRVETERLYNESVSFTKRRFRDAKETISMLEEAMLEGFTDSISPLTVQTMMMLVGDQSLQFRFVNSMTNPQQAVHTVEYDAQHKVLKIDSGIIQHMTLGINSLSQSGGHSASEYKFWSLPAFESPVLADPDRKYYVYAKVERDSRNGVFYMSETAKSMESDAAYYYLLMGLLNSEYDGERSYVSLYGFTEILPGQVTTDIIRDSGGKLVIDLANAVIRAKDGARIEGDIHIGSGSSGLSNLEEWDSAQESISDAQQTASEALLMAQESKDFIDNTLPDEIAEINRKLDGVVETWFYPYSPTLQNEPAVSWIRDGEQEKHIGDMFLNNQEYVDNGTTPDAGKAWRWEKNTSGAYFWNPVADSDAVKALQDAAKAQDTADQKRRVFVTTPYTPYDVGDMWVQGSAGDIMRCIKARATGSYTASDWDKAGKYTDDTVAKDALSKAGDAQAAADAAQQEADQARKDAEAAQSAADAAQSAADAAQDTADAARGDADAANGLLSDLMSDSVITPPEKTALRQQHSDIKAEYSQILADAGKYGINTSAYTSAYNAANSALAKYTADTPQNIPVGSDYNSISAYYTARQSVLDSIATAAKKVATDAQSAADAAQDTADMAQDAADAAQSAADAAQDTADEAAANASSALQKIAAAQADIQDVQSDVNGLQGYINDLDAYVDGAFRDGVIDEAEAIAIGKYVNTVNESWTDLQASYNVVYNNSYLTGTAKTNLKSAYDTLSSRKNTLITAINKAVSQPTTANVTAVDTAFTAYNTAVSSFKTAVENANKAIQDAIRSAAGAAQQAADAAQAAADSAADAADMAQEVADEAADRLDEWADDGKIGPTEKPALKDEIARIAQDKTQIADGYTEYGLGTPTSYNTAYDNYRKQLVSLTAASPESIAIPSTFRSNQEVYYARRAEALAAISAAAKTVVENLEIGVTNIVKDGRLSLSGVTSYNIAYIRTWHSLTTGGKYTAVLSGKVSGSQRIGIWDSAGSTKQGLFTLKSGRIYTLTFTYKKTASASANVLSLYNYPSTGSSANPADIDWICIYEGDVKAPSIFMEAPEDMSVGGVNIARMTNQGILGWGWSMQTGGYTRTEVVEGGIRCCKLTRDTNAQSGWSVIAYANKYIGRDRYVAGRQYTVSFEVKSSVASSFAIGLKDDDGSDEMAASVEYRVRDVKANEWTKVWAVLTMKSPLPASTAQELYLTGMASGTGVSHTFRNLKIEEGTFSTAWSPAPEDMDEAIDSLKNFTDEAFADGVIDRAEAAAIEKYTNSVNETLKSVQGTYSALYGNSYLTGTPKTNLYTAYNAVVQATNALLTAIADAIEDSVATADDKAAVDSAYATLNTRLQTFQTRVEEANKAIQDALKDYADDLEAQMKTDYDYLKETFGQVTDSTGVYLSKMVAVQDANNEVQAFMNGSDLGKDTTHGKLLIAAGVTDIENPQNAATRIYEDGYISTSSGTIGGFTITESSIYSDNIRISLERFYVNGINGTFTIEPEKTDGTPLIDIWNTLRKRYGTLMQIAADGDCQGNDSCLLELDNTCTNTSSGAIAVKCEHGLFAGLRPMTRLVTSSETLSVMDFNVLCYTSSGAFTLKMPSTRQAGQTFLILKNGSQTLTLNGNGKNIERLGYNSAQSFNIEGNFEGLCIVVWCEKEDRWWAILVSTQ